mgnify:CR=1 FL=1
MKNLKILIALVVFVSFISCNNKRMPQVQYMPDMYESIPYDTDGEKGLNNKPVNRPPVAGTIPRGGFPAYDIPDTPEGYERARLEVANPIEASEKNLEKGKQLYTIYCTSCHGEKGDGKGNLVKREKFLGVPSYADREVTNGSIFHVVTYGLNSMGSHANQLSQEERWQVADYVLKLKSEL